jgi:hypothetical protein
MYPVSAIRGSCQTSIIFLFKYYLPFSKKSFVNLAANSLMSDQQISYLPYDQAIKVVGAIQEEEHPHELNRRIFTVYDISGKEVCWFDAEDTIAIVAPGKVNQKKTEVQPLVEDYILNHIPDWS